MKKLICYLLMTSTVLALKGQAKIEILLVGTQHEFSDSLKHRQNFDLIRKNLSRFSPDIICIESIPPFDAASLKEVRGNQLVLAEQLRKEKNLVFHELKTDIGGMIQEVEANPTNLNLRSNLANSFYAHHDFWNAYYHYYQLTNALDSVSVIGADQLNASFALDSIHSRVTKNHSKGEYNNIVFPLAQQLRILSFENIDYRADEDEFLSLIKKVAIGTIFNLKIFKLKKMMKNMQAEMLNAEREGTLMNHINSTSQQEFYLDLIDNAHQFKKSKNMRKTVALWEFRNKVMAERILMSASENKAKRVLVTFGAFHVPFVKRYLERNANVRVITYDQYISGLIKNEK